MTQSEGRSSPLIQVILDLLLSRWNVDGWSRSRSRQRQPRVAAAARQAAP